MTQHGGVGGAAASFAESARMIRWVATRNPFYVISAGLFLAGLRVSFGDPNEAASTWGMMGGLAGYTLLLAATACLLVRYATVWDDVRTVLLLVVLMFLATSVTFDEVLVLTPERGIACYLAGLALAVAVSEGILWFIRLRLPAGFRLPYYLVLALFFLYPLVLQRWVTMPRSPALLWGLYGFGPAAGLVFLTLLPAIRRGAAYVEDNGSPWRWPLYPWTLFGLLALAVPARSFLLCWSMHLLDNGDRDTLVFGPHFLAPFGMALAILLLEIGLVARRRGVVAVALTLPLMLVAVSLIGHRADAIYGEFLDLYVARLGATPAFVALAAALALYTMAALRRAPFALEGITVALAAFSVVGPNTLAWGDWWGPHPAPLLAAGALQLGLGIWRRSSWRSLAGTVGLTAGFTLVGEVTPSPWRGAVAFHAALFLMMLLGALFDDAFSRLLRGMATLLAVTAGLTAMAAEGYVDAPWWALALYPAALGMILMGYGLWLRETTPVAAATILLLLWSVVWLVKGYTRLRALLEGLDYLVASLAVFAVAVLVSIAKARLHASREPAPPT